MCQKTILEAGTMSEYTTGNAEGSRKDVFSLLDLGGVIALGSPSRHQPQMPDRERTEALVERHLDSKLDLSEQVLGLPYMSEWIFPINQKKNILFRPDGFKLENLFPVEHPVRSSLSRGSGDC